MEWLGFALNWAVARIVRASLVVFGPQKKLDVAFISCYRDDVDVRKFGFWSIRNTPNVLHWARYFWQGVNGRLFMIGSLTWECGGKTATKESINRARDQFFEACKIAYRLGARTFLHAANTKRLFENGELEACFPGAIFTVGDNFTGLLLWERIIEAFKLSLIAFVNARVLIIAPYGLLGMVATKCCKFLGCVIVGLGNPERKDLLEAIPGITPVYSYEEAFKTGKFDMVIACNSAAYVTLTRERIEMLRRPGTKLLVVDPNEPAALPPDVLKESKDVVIRHDAGNGYSRHLKYVLGRVMYSLLRLDRGVTWGCFCESFLIAKLRKSDSRIADVDWRAVNATNMKFVSEWLGDRLNQFALPAPTCYNRPLVNFNVVFSPPEKSIIRMLWREAAFFGGKISWVATSIGF